MVPYYARQWSHNGWMCRFCGGSMVAPSSVMERLYIYAVMYIIVFQFVLISILQSYIAIELTMEDATDTIR